MASKKLELVNFELHNYCSRQDGKADFSCEDMHCESCPHNKKYLLTVDGRGIDARQLEQDYYVQRSTIGGRSFMRLRPRHSAGRIWLLGLLLLFGLTFGLGYYVAVSLLLE